MTEGALIALVGLIGALVLAMRALPPGLDGRTILRAALIWAAILMVIFLIVSYRDAIAALWGA